MFKKTKLFAIIATLTIGSATFAEETNLLAEWVNIYYAEQTSAYLAHPDLPDIEKGAALHLTALGVNPAYSNKVHGGQGLTVLGQHYYDAYKTFITGPGAAMVEKWNNDGELSPENEAYKWVIHAAATEYTTAEGHFSPSADTNIAQSIVKSYFREPLTREEVDAMRMKLGIMGQAPGWTCGMFNINSRVLENWLSIIDWSEHFEYINGIKNGTTAPNIRYLRYDELSKKPIEDIPIQFSLDAFVTPRGIASLNDCVSSLNLEEEGGQTMFVANYSDFEHLFTSRLN